MNRLPSVSSYQSSVKNFQKPKASFTFVGPSDMAAELATPPQPVEAPLYNNDGVDLNPYSQSGDEESKTPWLLIGVIATVVLVAFSSKK